MVDRTAFEGAGTLRRGLLRVAASRPGSWLFARVAHHADRIVWRLTGQRHTLASLTTGLPIVMVTTTGARSGLARTVPLVGVPTQDGLAIVASNHGQRQHPGWYHNLRADPTGEVTVDGQTWPFRAIEAGGAQRGGIWRHCLDVYPGYAVYEQRAAQRHIGVFLLEPTR